MASKVAILCFAVAVLWWSELRATSGAVLFDGAYSDTSLVDDIERELLRFDGGIHSLADEGEVPDFRTDFDLSQLHPISATPSFTLDPSYIGPDDVFLATRTKRANWVAQDASKRAKLRKRKQDKERLEDDEERERLVEEDEEEDGKVVSSADEREPAEPLEDYATRYEQFIAKHFDDDDGGGDVGSSKRREKSAQTRKAPARKPSQGARDDDDDGDREEQDGDYKFDRFDYSSSADYERIKAESEEQSKRLAADPRNCRTYEKDGMVCSVCHDPTSESASENCAYATEPHHRKYAFVKERNYDSKKDAPQEAHDADDEGDDDGEGDGRADSRPEREAVPSLGSTTTTNTPDRKRHPLRRPILRSNPHQLATVVTTNGGGYRYQPPAIDLRSNRAMKLQAEPTADGADEPTDIYVMDYGDQDDVAKVLKDFASRDWSNCRKGNRTEDGELTCYQCRDAAGVNHEECMYVSESRQTATGIVSPPDPPKDQKVRKRKKVVPLRKAALVELMSPRIEIEPQPGKQNKKQTVKRTVSFRSYVAGSGLGRPGSSTVGTHGGGRPGGPGERVIHYEHHISHEVP